MNVKNITSLNSLATLVPDELFSDASTVAGDVRVRVELPRVLAVAGDPRNDQEYLGKKRSRKS